MTDIAITRQDDPNRLRGRTRWSRASQCPRMAAMGLLGAEPEPMHDPERRAGQRQRGKDAQRYHAHRLIAKFGADDIVTEKAVPWPAPPALPVGELHQDFFIASEKMVVEVKSSATDSSFDAYATQTAGEVYFDPEAEYGALTFLDHDYQERAVYPIIVTDQTAELLEGIVAQVVEAGRTGVLPERTCEKPSDAIGKFCPFVAQCFEGWVEPEVVVDDKSLAKLFTDYWIAKRERDARKEETETAQAALDAAKVAILEAGVAPGRTLCNGIEVNRIPVKGAETFSLAKARKAGVWNDGLDELLGPFTSVGDGYDRLDVKRVGDDPLVVLDPADDSVPF